jgi:group I intron endonuclease
MKFIDLHSEKREDLNKTGVYLITLINKPNWYYIGSAAKMSKKKYNDVGFLQRWRNHFSTLKNNKHFNPILQRTVNKYDIENIRFKILELCEPEDCIFVEDKWLQYYIKYHNVYNINKVHPTKLGYITSEETKLKISKSRNKKKVYQFNFEGNLVKEWECFNHILQEFPKGKGSIWRCLNNLQQTSNGYIWSYKNVFEYKPFNKSKIVLQLDLNNNIINQFSSTVEAFKKTSIHGIHRCCINKGITAGGFKWKYKN